MRNAIAGESLDKLAEIAAAGADLVDVATELPGQHVEVIDRLDQIVDRLDRVSWRFDRVIALLEKLVEE